MDPQACFNEFCRKETPYDRLVELRDAYNHWVFNKGGFKAMDKNGMPVDRLRTDPFKSYRFFSGGQDRWKAC